MDILALFIGSVRSAHQLPPWVREHADEVRDLSESRFDQTYIQFLDEQIGLAARGPEWTEILRQRRADLQPFCGVTLLYGWYPLGNTQVTIRVHPETKAVVQWEEY